MRTQSMRIRPVFTLLCGLLFASTVSVADDFRQNDSKSRRNDSKTVAAKIDRLLNAAVKQSGGTLAARTADGDFLRRVTFDLAGKSPSVRDVMLFGLNPDFGKRAVLIDKLLASDNFSRNWGRYWRDVIMSRATDRKARIALGSLENWLTEQFRNNRRWDGIVTDLITATGDVREKGETGMIFAHNADAKELAAETSRIFLGIQIQCANCHDHPTDIWKREQFHQLAAYFPRIRVRPVRDPKLKRIRSWEVVSAEYGRRGGFAINPVRFMRQFDTNEDGKVSTKEVQGTPLERRFRFLLRNADRNRDGAISQAEIERAAKFAQRRRQGGVEYYMPDLKAPSSKGKKMSPTFFVGTVASPGGLKDVDRRNALAKLLTAKENKWFARAFVNRIWAEMLGEGFYMPVDDLGPQRKARFENVLVELSSAFRKSGYDVKWLFRTIANTEAYQRQMRVGDAADTALPFASASPTRLRGDQIYDALLSTLAVRSLSNRNPFGSRRRFGGGGYRRFGGERAQFTRLFNFDPSTPQADIVGTVPQALFLMNSPALNNLIRRGGRSRLATILRNNSKNDDALSELYLMVHSRDPSAVELKICKQYINKVGNRSEAFEDILWSLLNSSEFMTKR